MGHELPYTIRENAIVQAIFSDFDAGGVMHITQNGDSTVCQALLYVTTIGNMIG